MKETRLEPARDFRVIIRGPLVEAIRAAGGREHRPLRNVEENDDGTIHATMGTNLATLEQWFAADHANQPGALLSYTPVAKL